MIDWTRISDLKTEFGTDGFEEILAIFFEETEPVIERLSRGHSGDPAADLHFVRGSADNMGLSDLVAACRRGEAAVAAGAPPDITGVRHAFDGARRALLRMAA